MATLQSPAPSLTWAVGDTISFAATAADQEDGTLPASAFSFSLIVRHCPATCHSHVAQTFAGVRSGTFSAPDHDYPSHLELRLTVTDSGGLTDVETVELQPRTTSLTFTSSPSGLQLVVGSQGQATPFTRTAIVGSNTSIAAPSPQTLGAQSYGFVSWSDGGAATHNVIAPAAGATYHALFGAATAPSGLVAAYGFDELERGDDNGLERLGEHRHARRSDPDGGGTVRPRALLRRHERLRRRPRRAVARPHGDDDARGLGAPDRARAAHAPGRAQGSAAARSTTSRPGTRGARRRTSSSARRRRRPAPARSRSRPGRISPQPTTARRSSLWVNGNPVGSRPVSGSILGSTGGLRIGGASLRDWFQGRIDEVRIYDRALTAQEIAADMAAPVNP